MQCILLNQGVFVEKTQIMDNIFIVEEDTHSRRGKERGMVIKLDMENSFDRMRQNLLFVVLDKFGFGEDLLAWISSCINV